MLSTIENRIGEIARISQTDVGRNIAPLASAVPDDLKRASLGIAESVAPSVVVLTGAYIPWASPAAAETDGPPGAAMLATGLATLGVPTRLLTDSWCFPVVSEATSAAGDSNLVVDRLDSEEDLSELVRKYETLGVTHLVSVERMGRAADGRVHNFRGEDITAFTPPSEALMNVPSWTSIGIGDGGNELGMGRLSSALVSSAIADGQQIHCVTSSDALIVSGVSNWGALALLAAIALVRGVPANGLLRAPAADLHQEIVDACVRAGAVDGTLGRRIATVDGLERPVNDAIIGEIWQLSSEP